MKRSATANWKGGLKAGKGTFSSASGTFSNVPYDFAQRFETGAGTSPEELIAAAHASCFAMALSAELEKVGLVPENIDSKAASERRAAVSRRVAARSWAGTRTNRWLSSRRRTGLVPSDTAHSPTSSA